MFQLAFLEIGCLIAFAGLLAAAAWQDLRTMRIADGLSLAIVGVFLAWSTMRLFDGAFSLEEGAWTVACAALLFVAGAAAFAIGMMGGGDVKLIAAAGLFAGPSLVADYLLVIALMGGALGIAVLAGLPIVPIAVNGGDTAIHGRVRRGLPYGPAIAAGGLWIAGLRALG